MANRIIIPIGTKFGRLTVIDNSELKHLCRCECGTIKAIDMYSLLKGDTMSCGCHKINCADCKAHPKMMR